MIEDPAVDGLGRAGQAAGRAHVAFARGGVTARVIVGKHDSGASVDGGIADDRTQREIHPGFVAVVMAEVQAIQLVIDMGDPQTLTPGIRFGDAAGKECPGCGEALELERKFGTLISHAPRLKDFGFAND
jgi:hypothetical protein